MSIFDDAAAELGIPTDELEGTFPPSLVRRVTKRCPCGNTIENRHDTCDECQDAAYQGDAFGRW